MSPNSSRETEHQTDKNIVGSVSVSDWMAALSEDTPPGELERLANSSNLLARVVGSNAAAPDQLLRRLAAEGDEPVQDGVAGNPQCPEDLLWELIGQAERSPAIAYTLAGNPALTDEMILHLWALYPHVWSALLRREKLDPILIEASMMSGSETEAETARERGRREGTRRLELAVRLSQTFCADWKWLVQEVDLLCDDTAGAELIEQVRRIDNAAGGA